MLHGEQRFDYHAPVVVGDTLTFRPRVTGVTEKKGGAMTLVVVETAVTNQNGVHVADVSRTVVVAIRGRHEPTQLSSRSASASSTRNFRRSRATGWRCIAARRAITIRSMSIWILPRQAGFPDVFSHGMLVMAYLGQALTDAVPPPRLRSFSTRFVAITQLGARLTCEGMLPNWSNTMASAARNLR